MEGEHGERRCFRGAWDERGREVRAPTRGVRGLRRRLTGTGTFSGLYTWALLVTGVLGSTCWVSAGPPLRT